MRLLVEDIIAELKQRLGEAKGIRDRVLLKDAIKALSEYKSEKEKRF